MHEHNRNSLIVNNTLANTIGSEYKAHTHTHTCIHAHTHTHEHTFLHKQTCITHTILYQHILFLLITDLFTISSATKLAACSYDNTSINQHHDVQYTYYFNTPSLHEGKMFLFIRQCPVTIQLWQCGHYHHTPGHLSCENSIAVVLVGHCDNKGYYMCVCTSRSVSVCMWVCVPVVCA